MMRRRLSSDNDGLSRILSVLAVAHTAGHGILAFLGESTCEARRLRLVSRELKYVVALFPWCDHETVILGSMHAWHSSFPCAVAARLSSHRLLIQADFELISRVQQLNLAGCSGQLVALGAFSCYCTKLTSLSFQGQRLEAHVITDQGIMVIAGNCALLTNLNLRLSLSKDSVAVL